MEISLEEFKSFVCKEKQPEEKVSNHSLVIGEAYFFRSVTHYYLGRLKSITETDLVLEDASWVADTGRFAQFLTSGNANELEPFPGDVIVFRGPLVDACIWKSKLPREQK